MFKQFCSTAYSATVSIVKRGVRSAAIATILTVGTVGGAVMTTAPAIAQVTLPATGVSGEDVSNAAVTEVTSFALPAILGGIALFALTLGVWFIRRQVKKGAASGG